MDKFFNISASGSSLSQEILCGLTTFLTMSYILFVNPSLLAQVGMSPGGVFAATALTAAVGSILMALVAKVPLAMAPGMGINTFLVFIVCGFWGFHWREALALGFLTGLLQVLIMATGLRKILVNAIPVNLKLAFGAGLGMFIAYIGLKSAGLITFTIPAGHYELTAGGAVICAGGDAVPSFIGALGAGQVVSLIGLAVMIALLALERKTGEGYAALPMGIIAATAVGIPLGVSNFSRVDFIDLTSLSHLGEVLNAFWGKPGLLSVFDSPHKIVISLLIITTLLLINVMDTIGTIMGVGRVQGAEIFNDDDLEKFSQSGLNSKLDKTLVVNSLGGSLATMLGSTPATTFMESITGIVAGGRTGLTALTVGVMFLVCLPLANFFSVIPAEAIAPALIVAGAFMVPLVARINWKNFEDSFPAFITIISIPLTYGFAYGIAAGVISHVLIQVAIGKGRRIHPMLGIIAFLFTLVVAMDSLR